MSQVKGIAESVRLPRLGKIRLGARTGGDDGSNRPVPTGYFVCPDEVKKVVGEKPRKLRIMFPTEDRDQWAREYFRRYSQSRRLICRGDGETAMARGESGTGQAPGRETSSPDLKEFVCNPRSCPHYRRGDCRRVMNLQFLLPDVPGFGVYELATSSSYSIESVNAFLQLVRGTCRRVSMIPLSLELLEQKVREEGRMKTVHVLHLSCPYSLAEIQRFTKRPPGQTLVLPPPDSEPPDDLFLEEQAGDAAAPEPAGADGQLLDLWARTKNKIWHFEIQESQVRSWFDKNYHLEVSLLDFDPPRPPEKLTAEMLSRFCQSVDLHAVC